MFYIVSYDIPDDQKRNRLAKTLLDFGNRVQYSVFECILDDILIEQLKARLAREVAEEDSVRIYALCAKCTKSAMVLGRGEISKESQDPFIL